MPRRYTGVRRYGFPRPPRIQPPRVRTCSLCSLVVCNCHPGPPPAVDPWLESATTLEFNPEAYR